MKNIIIILILGLLTGACAKKIPSTPKRIITIEKRESEHLQEVKIYKKNTTGGVNSSLDTLTVSQPDGTELEVVGKGNRIVSYAETTDGYTVVRNNKKIYEYADLSEEGALVPSGIKARNVGHRSKYEKNHLKEINKHLRFEGEKLKEMLKKSNP